MHLIHARKRIPTIQYNRRVYSFFDRSTPIEQMPSKQNFKKIFIHGYKIGLNNNNTKGISNK